MEFRTANPSPFKVLERLLQIDHRENEFVCKFSITLEAEHIKRIFEDSSLEIPRCELLPPSPPPPPLHPANSIRNELEGG